MILTDLNFILGEEWGRGMLKKGFRPFGPPIWGEPTLTFQCWLKLLRERGLKNFNLIDLTDIKDVSNAEAAEPGLKDKNAEDKWNSIIKN